MKRNISGKKGIFVFVLLFVLLISSGGCQLFSQPVSSDNAVISVYFPRADTDPAVVLAGLYNKATSSIVVAIFSFTHPTIVNGLLNAQKRGVKVRIITDQDQADDSTQKKALNNLAAIGIPVKVNTHRGLMHLKMSIIDKAIVAIGSYNYTQSASTYNDEVFSVIRDAAVVTACEQEFERMWNDTNNFTVYK